LTKAAVVYEIFADHRQIEFVGFACDVQYHIALPLRPNA